MCDVPYDLEDLLTPACTKMQVALTGRWQVSIALGVRPISIRYFSPVYIAFDGRFYEYARKDGV